MELHLYAEDLPFVELLPSISVGKQFDTSEQVEFYFIQFSFITLALGIALAKE